MNINFLVIYKNNELFIAYCIVILKKSKVYKKYLFFLIVS